MKVVTPQISWHQTMGIVTLDLVKTPRGSGEYFLATGGLEKILRIWKVFPRLAGDEQAQKSFNTQCQYVTKIKGFEGCINVTRFHPSGSIVASGDSQGYVMIHERSNSSAPDIFADKKDDDDGDGDSEIWNRRKTLCYVPAADVNDLAWSKDGSTLVCVGRGDPKHKEIAIKIWSFPEYAVQIVPMKSVLNGLALDPRGLFAAITSDRHLHIHCEKLGWKRQITVFKGKVPTGPGVEAAEKRLFLDDQALCSYVRRPAFSPDGELLVVPAGCLDDKYVTYLFTRKDLERPALVFPSPEKPSLGVTFSPVFYELRPGAPNLLDLPYRLVFAVMSKESLAIYDTQQLTPFAYIGQTHLAVLSDLAWTDDGRKIVACSMDGYCTVVDFDEGELGTPLRTVPPPPPSAQPSVHSKVSSGRKKSKGDASDGSISKEKKKTPLAQKTKPATPHTQKPASAAKSRDIRQFFNSSEQRKKTCSPVMAGSDDSSGIEILSPEKANPGDEASATASKRAAVPSNSASQDTQDQNQRVEIKASDGAQLPRAAKPPKRAALMTLASPSGSTTAPALPVSSPSPSPSSAALPDSAQNSPRTMNPKAPKRVKLMPA